ncbi:hypothetical protein TIFTF001_005098 [Ficus carica]|uniref:Uncharacterized protein n=1 Tax=Ficus carica TaxID=3494 RepID=A0AA87ZKU1_FICCA|nr:hypothetical protein TIFTF001_005098 [Ficus carica]
MPLTLLLPLRPAYGQIPLSLRFLPTARSRRLRRRHYATPASLQVTRIVQVKSRRQCPWTEARDGGIHDVTDKSRRRCPEPSSKTAGITTLVGLA